ncbi:RNA polymerase sigma factor [Fulvivirga sp. RKSG066]|uniref:RNA polymerase sigma factor n=1 Tax=Fulvivirga aurantia TaxID=2529383 RepID=UPI0012BC1C6E|nr:RNA polymerase sigma factor [Fulvivirga aurantia]MTI20303.1 RNA polymerase sigma factor [Fulvivirga aurantia]
MAEKEDHVYINQVLDGDMSAFAWLVDKHKQNAYTLALKIVKNEYDAEEVSQDAFLKAFKALSKFKQESSFSTWLYRIVYNTALSKIKKKQLDTTPIEDGHHNITMGKLTESMTGLIAEDRKKYLKLAINKLGDEEAVLVNLYYTAEKDMTEIAQVMDMSHVNVRVKLSRVRKKLYTILEQLLKGEIRNIV